MSDPLYLIDASTDAARRALSRAAPCSLDSWDTVVRHWRTAKAPLIAALCPDTARRIIAIAIDPTPHEIAASWRGACRTGALEYARESLTAALTPSLTDPDAHPERLAELETRRAASIARKESLVRLIEAARDSLCHLADYVTPREWSSAVASDYLATIDGVRRGQSLTRALAAYLRGVGRSADEAAQIVDTLSTAAQAAPRTGQLVLSASLLDILMCGESDAYTSCHSLRGCHCAGPLQYAVDPHTITVFYFEDVRRSHCAGLDLPRKLFRQMVYIDKAGLAAALQRHYGQSLPDAIHATIRREVAALLCRLGGLPDTSPHWHHGTEDRGATISRGAALAYIDPTVDYIALKKHGRPTIQLARRVPCPSCGDALDEADSVVCADCRSGDTMACHHCDGRHAVSDSRAAHGHNYCAVCYGELYRLCDHCAAIIDLDNTTTDDGHTYCQSCYNERDAIRSFALALIGGAA